jgi:chromosome segregation ATPase
MSDDESLLMWVTMLSEDPYPQNALYSVEKISQSNDSDRIQTDPHESKKTPRLTGNKRKSARSKELGKESRTRQRQRMEEVQKRIESLRFQNAELKDHLQNVTQRTTEVQTKRIEMERAMTAKLKEMKSIADSSNELEVLLHKFVDLYADYGSYRQKEVEYDDNFFKK